MRRTPLKQKRDKPRRKGPPAPRIKPKGRLEDPEHLDRLRELGCWCCWADGRGQVAPDIHHIRHGQGAAQRADDREAIPLCEGHHQGLRWPVDRSKIAFHRRPIEWEARYGTEEEVLAHVLLALQRVFD